MADHSPPNSPSSSTSSSTSSNNRKTDTLVVTTSQEPKSNKNIIVMFNPTQFPLKLTPNNYLTEKEQITSLMTTYRLLDFLEGTKPCPAIPSLAEQIPDSPFDIWVRQDQALRHALITAVSDSIAPRIATARTSNQAWLALEKLYANRSTTRYVIWRDRLHNLRSEGKTMTEYLDHIKMIVDELENMCRSVSNEELSVHVMNGLGPEFQEFCASIRACETPLPFEDFQDRLLAHEEALRREERRLKATPIVAHHAAAQKRNFRTPNSFCSTSGPNFPSNNFVTNRPIYAGNGSSQQPTSHSWNKPNKYYNQPRQQFNRRKNENWRPNNARNFNCQLCNQLGHFANNCPYFHVQAQAPMANYASSSGLSRNKWLIDSGANNHITNDLANLALHSEYDGPEELQIGDGSGLEITHIGEESSHGGNSASRAKQTRSLPNSRQGKF
ncbi:hypothetical protein SLEP1_g48274 [Rubroshorea leprosula]|uniref:CCHC-type domain-containing protein n=1 Tax=Rubroshorea leprosula TaxID=152421 RepID=A0AAV5LU17_9ROSI|nr:hypothetical protein SLEP1_g48274 [Rubroshorea leprosula]